MPNVYGMRLLREGYRMVILIEHHCCRSVELLRDEDNLVLAAEPLRMLYVLWVDNKTISLAQAIKLGTAANIYTTDVRCKSILTRSLQSLLSYRKAFKEVDSI